MMMCKTWQTSRRSGSAPAGLLVLAACGDKGLPYNLPGFDFRSQYQPTAPGAPVLLDNVAWWERLQDPVLDRLVARGLRDGITLEIARERTIAVEAARLAVPGAVTLSPSASATLAGTDGTPLRGTATARFGLDWILDSQGARRNAERAAADCPDAARAEQDAVHMLLVFNITQTYVDLRHAQ